MLFCGTERVTSKVQPGSIVLFHNAALHTPEALPGIIEALLQQGYTFVPISQLILPGTCGQEYTIDHTGRQCPWSSDWASWFMPSSSIIKEYFWGWG